MTEVMLLGLTGQRQPVADVKRLALVVDELILAIAQAVFLDAVEQEIGVVFVIMALPDHR